MSPRWRHQEQAFQFVLGLWRGGVRGAMLAMAMGTGKSRVAIELADELPGTLALILCPLRVVEVWEQQFARFSPGWICIGLDNRAGGVADKTVKARQWLNWAQEHHKKLVLVINYESARQDPFASWALGKVWPLVIADEVHRAKEPGGRTSRFLGRLGLVARRKLGLTGTPFPHSPLDIWAQYRFLDPTVFDSTFGSFKIKHTVSGGYMGKQVVAYRDLDQLHENFKRIAFRVDDSVLDLPPELDQVLSADMAPEGTRIYREMEEEFCAWLGTGELVTAANAMVKLLRLQQITGGYLPVEGQESVRIDNAKENLLVDFLSDLDPLEPCVIFARFSSDLKSIRRASLRAGRLSAELSGERDERRSWTKDGRMADLAVQIQAGGTGVDFSRAHIGVYYSFGFSLADYVQSRARIRRPPQDRPCVFYHLQIRNSIDQYILRAIERRSDLVGEVLHELKKKEKVYDVAL